MKITFVDNENAKLVDVLKESLRNANDVKFSVAFLKYSGFSLIKSHIENILKNRGVVEFLVGLDFRTTDPDTLSELKFLQAANANLKCFCFSEPNKNTYSIFHPKLYLMKNSKKTIAIIGSSNLTKGGLVDNVELNVILSGKESDSEILQLSNFYLRSRLRESVFEPSIEYIESYRKIYDTVLVYNGEAFKKEDTKKELKKLQEMEELLPGTRPTVRRLIIDAIKTLPKTNEGYVQLQDIYDYVKSELRKYGEDFSAVVNINANIRRTIYGDLIDWKRKYNRGYFERKSSYSGLFRLTDIGLKFKGR